MAPLSQPSAHYSSPSPSSSRPSSSSSTSTMNRASSIDPTLLTPVRSKRTPIACTECRRRQVKCSGETPNCARCKQKGSKCEYIPCSQQRAQQSSTTAPNAVSSSQNPAAVRNSAAHSRSPSLGLEYPSAQWQQSTRNQQYALESTYPSSVDWRTSSSTSNSTSLAQQRGHPQAALSSQSYATGMTYGDHFQSQSAYGMGHSVRSDGLYTHSYAPSHRERMASSAHSGYPHTDFSMGLSNMSAGYSGVDHGASHISTSSSHHTGYPSSYYQTDDSIFMSPNGMVSGTSDQGWVSSMPSYQGHHYA